MKPKIMLLAGIAIIFATAACNRNPSKNTAKNADPSVNKKLEEVFNKYWEQNLKLNPVMATFTGDNRYNDQLPNFATHAYRDTLKVFYQTYLDSVQSLDRAKLSDDNKISYDIFLYDVGMELKGLELNTWMIPYDQEKNFPAFMAMFGSGNSVQPFKTVKDYDNWRHRMKGFTVWIDSAIANFRQGMKVGVVLPQVLVKKMVTQLNSLTVSTIKKSRFYNPIVNMPENFSDADKKRITEDYKSMIQNEIDPAYKKLSDFLNNEYLPKARTTSGISSIPGGRATYEYLAKYWTTTDRTPEQIYQTGLEEVKRITGIMDSVKNAIGFDGDLQALFHYIKTNKKFFPFQTPQQVLDSFETIYQKIQPNIKKLYGHVPKMPFEIRQTEKFREKTAAVAQYMPGAPDGSRPGVFYVPIPDARKFNATDMENVFLHEAVPGHHFQTAIQQEDTSLPKFRRFRGNGAYDEGYALYCESLGKKLGMYSDPYQYLEALSWEMHRAVRLVLDVAIHTKNMSRETAIKYIMEHEPMDRNTAAAEVERYMANPGQALAYKTGELKIISLRDKYKKERGNKFSLSDFHDELLSGGSMPLKILGEKMDAWAAKQQR